MTGEASLMMAGGETAMARLTDLLRHGAAQLVEAEDGLRLRMDSGECHAIPLPLLQTMMRQGLIRRKAGRLLLTPKGRKLRKASLPEENAARRGMAHNIAESPLALLAARRTRDGRPFLQAHEIDAGERLRSDFERGLLAPRIGMSWSAVAPQRHRGARAAPQELADSAIAARHRVEEAIAAVGPELAGILLDICCFLKGLEQVEFERGWPVRSAKLMLKAALGALARHYWPARERGDAGARTILHWGAEDYRPAINGG